MALSARFILTLVIISYVLRYSGRTVEQDNYYRVYEYHIHDFKYNSGEYIKYSCTNIRFPIWLLLLDTGHHDTKNRRARRPLTLNHRRWVRRLRRVQRGRVTSCGLLPSRLSRPRVACYVRHIFRRQAVLTYINMEFLLLLQLCCGDVDSNPGPSLARIPRICECCGISGRRNQIFLSCSHCEKQFHRTCSKITPEAFR
jgi:hypothetical protein